MSERFKRVRARLAWRLRHWAHRVDPQVTPYGEWDPKQGVLVVKAGGLPLASLNIDAGMVQTDRGTRSGL